MYDRSIIHVDSPHEVNRPNSAITYSGYNAKIERSVLPLPKSELVIVELLILGLDHNAGGLHD
jgi:hypothetical protein